jgi:hypothetical protein
MRRGLVIGFAILGLAACGQRQEQSAPTATGAPTATSAPAESAAPASAAKESAPAPDVAAPANPDATHCLDLVAAGSYEQAVPICAAALNADAANERVKEALATANAKLAELSAGAAGSAAGEAEDAAQKAQEAVPVPKSY